MLIDQPHRTHVVVHIALQQLNLLERAGIALGDFPLRVVVVGTQRRRLGLFEVLVNLFRKHECVPCEVRRGREWEARGCAETVRGVVVRKEGSLSMQEISF
jgi:hypothetical protein